jgi:hypothetical protein
MSRFNSKLSIVRPMRQRANNGSNHMVETVDAFGMFTTLVNNVEGKVFDITLQF